MRQVLDEPSGVRNMSILRFGRDATAVDRPPAYGVMVARQPIFDRSRNVQAYELLYRSGSLHQANVSDGNQATANVVITSLLDIGLKRLVQERQACINMTRDLLVSRAALALPADKVILEVLEDVEVDAELIAAVRDFSDRGYRFALDDFSYDPSWEPLVEMARFVKLDVQELSLDQVEAHIERLHNYDVQIVAEKVETEAQYQALRAMGCDFFQGYFFARPNVVHGSRLPSNKLAALRLLAVLRNSNTDLEQVAELVSQDPSLSYRLIRFINSAAIGLATRVTSVRRAVAYLGLDAVRRWVSLTTIMRTRDKSEELIRVTLIRARMMELLCARLPRCDADTGFTVGLFSTLDVFMEQSMDEVVQQLRLTPEINSALLHCKGRHGKALLAVLAYERGDWEDACTHAEAVSQGVLGGIYAAAVRWAHGAVFESL